VARVAIDAVIFDLDGVIVDSCAPVTRSINAALADHGMPTRPAADLRRFIGPPTFTAFAELTGEDADSAVVAAVVASYRAHYAGVYLAQTSVIEGMVPVLEALAARLALAIATSKSVTFTEPLLEALGLGRFFAAVAAASPSDISDDKTAIVGRALDALDRPDAAMVGDRAFDIHAARAHGLLAIGVTWGIGGDAELTAAGADRIVGDHAELLDAVRRRLASQAVS
jgi:phosphoglycolate phosphatase